MPDEVQNGRHEKDDRDPGVQTQPRDVVRRIDAPVTPVHGDVADVSASAAQRWTPESALRRLEAILACREAIELNVKPKIAVEAMMLSLWRG